MKKKGSYMSEADIPEEDKHLYKQVGGKWVLDTSLFDDDEIENLVVPGLTTNKDNLKKEKTVVKEALEEEKKKSNELQQELDKIKKPGTKVLSKEEALQYEEYTKLGPAKDIEKALEDKKKIEDELNKTKAEKEDEKLAQDAKIDKEAFADFKATRGQGLSFSTKTLKEKDKKGKENDRVALMVQFEENENGVSKKRELEFTEYAKEKNVPQYLVNAIFSSNGESSNEPDPKQRKRFHVPDLATGKSKKEETAKSSESGMSFAERRNAERSTRKMPWSKVKEEEK